MFKKRIILGVLVSASLFLGAYQLESSAELFSTVNGLCCDNGVCDGSLCSSLSGARVSWNNCQDYYGNCMNCMDYIAESAMCNYLGPQISWCVTTGGAKYYSTLSIEGDLTDRNGISGSDGYYYYLTGSPSIMLQLKDLLAAYVHIDGDSAWIENGNKYINVVSVYDLNPKVVANDKESIRLEIEENFPVKFELNQNYPNPFNPSTQIRFGITEASNVGLKVFDIQGREVATLVDNKQMEVGYHNVKFDAKNLASGIYIYKLTTGNHSISKKMQLMK